MSEEVQPCTQTQMYKEDGEEEKHGGECEP